MQNRVGFDYFITVVLALLIFILTLSHTYKKRHTMEVFNTEKAFDSLSVKTTAVTPKKEEKDINALREFTGLNEHLIAFIMEQEQVNNLPKGILFALIERESCFDNSKIGASGEIGFCQLHPNTHPSIADELGIPGDAVYSETENIRMGAYYLNKLYKRYDCIDTALTAYNRGEGGMKKVVSRQGNAVTPYSSHVKERAKFFANMLCQ